MSPVSILLVEDNPRAARRLRETLNPAGLIGVSVTLARSIVGIPDGEGVRAIERIHKTARRAPVVAFSDLADPATPRQAFREGAQEFLVKDQFHSGALRSALSHAIEQVRGFDAYF